MAPKSNQDEPTVFADSACEQQTSSSHGRQPANQDLTGPSDLNPAAPQERQEAVGRQARVSKSFKKWKCRLRVFFCCLGYKKNKDSITDVASLFAEFYDDLKVSSSEFVAGVLLLSKYQAAQREWTIESKNSNVEQYLSSIPIRPSSKFLDVSTAEDSHLVNDLIYYMNYSLAIFGWPISLLDDPCKICCLFPFMRFSTYSGDRARVQPANEYQNKGHIEEEEEEESSGKSSLDKKHQMGDKPKLSSSYNGDDSHKLDESYDQPIILQDNCCGCNTASVESRLSDHIFETIYVTYRVEVCVVPFLVVADHSKRTIVVAIRGSMSLADVVTDMNGLKDKIPVDDCPTDWHSHKGITKAARNVKAVISKEHILDRAFNCRPDLGSQDYTLVLCGHSLGAGVAAVLGILMRKDYPSLRAYLYSPPGGMLCLSAVEYTKEFAVSVILGNDIVPRLGVAQLERLRYHVLLSLKSSRKSPAKIIAKALCPSCCCASTKVEYDPNESIDLLDGLSARPFQYAGTEVPFQVQQEVLYVPGRVLHIVRNYSFKTRAHRLLDAPIYQAVWSDNTAYDRIMVGEGMFRDHLPNHVMDAMKMLFYKTLPARKEVRPATVNLPTSDSRSAATQYPAADQQSVAQTDRACDLKFSAACDGQNIVIEDENNNKATSEADINNNSNVDRDNYIPAEIYVEPKSARNSDSRESKIVADDKLTTQIGFDSNGNDEGVANKNYSQLDG